MNIEKTVKKMRQNKRDWLIKDILKIANHFDINVVNNGSSHYVLKHAKVSKNLSIPNHKDLHPSYITLFLNFLTVVDFEFMQQL